MASVGSCRSCHGRGANKDVMDDPPPMVVTSVGFRDMSTCRDGDRLEEEVNGLEGGEGGSAMLAKCNAAMQRRTLTDMAW